MQPNGVGGSDQRGRRGGWEPFPIFMARGYGPYLEDVDGNRYVDYLGAWGPMILGNRPTKVIEAVHRTIDEIGPLLGFNHELEVRAASLAIEAVPCWEMMRFSNTGTEAVMLALRIARAYTNRTKVLRFEGHFHGWSDSIYFTVEESQARSDSTVELPPIPATHGVVKSLAESVVIRRWNDPDVLRQTFAELGDELAAVICEPLFCSPVISPRPGYLELLRELTRNHGVVLVFDEVKTGFRVALGGAQELYGVTPDMSTAAKALGGGIPVAAVGGQKELFEPFTSGYIAQGSTYQANPIALAAVLATLEELRVPGFFERITTLGERLADGITALCSETGIQAYAQGVGPVLQPVFADHQVKDYRDFIRSSDGAAFREFWTAMLEGGVVFAPRPGGCWFVSGAHSDEDIEFTLEVAEKALADIDSANRRTG